MACFCLAAAVSSAAGEVPELPSADPSELILEPGALKFSNIFALIQREPNLTGQGVRIAAVCPSQSYINNHPQNDYRFNMNHASLYDADVHFTDGTDGRLGVSSHATAIAGVLLGIDKNGQAPDGRTFEYHGACPGATVTVHEFWRFAMMHLFGKRSFDADLITLSLGEMYETWWTRSLDLLAAQKDVLVIASIGNGSGVLTPRPLYPGAGSNVLGVGVVDSITDANGVASLSRFGMVRQEHSSTGPTEDLRCKPDLVAPGTALVPLYNKPAGYETVDNWSSLSAPIVCGTAALLLEKANGDQTLKDAMSGAKSLVLKSILINSACKLPYWHKGKPMVHDDHEVPLDFQQGAGLLDAAAAFEQLTAGPSKPGEVPAAGWDNRILEKDGWGYEYAFSAPEPNQVITVTLCWNHLYADVYPYARQSEKDSDLRLELWGIDANDLANEILLDYSDSVNDNLEHLYVRCDSRFSAYAIRVKFNPNTASAGAQQFALAWSASPDGQYGNPLWYDINGDSLADNTDQLTYVMLDRGMIKDAVPSLLESLKLTPQRAVLLSTHWTMWKNYMPGYDAERNEEPAGTH